MLSTAKTSAVENSNPLDSKTLESYIIALKQGDKNALARIYESTRVAVYGFSLSILKNAFDAQDVLQATYIKLYESADTYVKMGKPMAYIFTIARNLSLMKIRERSHSVDISEEAWLNISADSDCVATDDKLILEGLMKNLSDEERQIVTLHAVSGFKHREIAALLKLPLSTVLSKYHRAIKRLKATIGEG